MIIEEIQVAFPKLRKSEQKAASYMLEHVEEMEKISLGKMAKGAEVSEATVIRMLKAVGYKSFKEIKIAFVEERMKKKEIDEANRGILGISMKKGDQIEDVPHSDKIKNVKKLRKNFFCRKFKCSSRRFADKADVFGYLL